MQSKQTSPHLKLGLAVLTGAALSLTLVVSSCDGDGSGLEDALQVTAVPATVHLGEDAHSEIVISAKPGNSALIDGEIIKLETTLGTWEKDYPDWTETEVMVEGGRAKVKLFSKQPGEATITATAIVAGEGAASGSTKVRFVHPEVHDLIFRCASQNIGALISDAQSMKIPCVAYAVDEANNLVPSAKINFAAEAGGFDSKPYETNDDRIVWLYDPRGGDGKLPRDVDPFDGEPRWSPPGSDKVKNPRDGLVTLIAWTDGVSYGQGAPYVDANDNNVYDEGEWFHRMDGDQYLEEQDRIIWKQVKILWTGEAFPPRGTTSNAEATSVNRPSASIGRGQSVEFLYRVLDENLNILAANSTNDKIQFYLSANGGEIMGGSGAVPLHRGFGIDIDENQDYRIRNPNDANSYRRNSEYRISVRNARTDDEPTPESGSLTGEIQRIYSIDPDGNPYHDIYSEQVPYVDITLP